MYSVGVLLGRSGRVEPLQYDDSVYRLTSRTKEEEREAKMLFLGIVERNREGSSRKRFGKDKDCRHKAWRRESSKRNATKGKEPPMKGGSKERNREQQSIDEL
jgi:hypothetical protein